MINKLLKKYFFNLFCVIFFFLITNQQNANEILIFADQITYDKKNNIIAKGKAKILYENNIGKDMVLQILFNGNEINPGEMVPKKSKIDLVLGNGIIDEKFEDGSK